MTLLAKRKELWIADAFKKHKEGALHRQLGIPQKTKIPRTLLAKIKRTALGKKIINPTKTGKRRITVTRLLKSRAVLVHTVGSF